LQVDYYEFIGAAYCEGGRVVEDDNNN
jgi:hypothetical protein